LTNLTILSPEDRRWGTFVAAHASSPFQSVDWLKTLTSAYGLTAQVVVLIDNEGELKAGLPLVRSMLPIRKRWTCLPFTDVVEPIATNSATREELLMAIANDWQTDPIIIRANVSAPGWTSRQVGTVRTIDVTDGASGVLRDAGSNAKREVKRANKETSLRAAVVNSREEFLGPYYRLTARSRRRVGVPTQPRRYWSRVWDLHEEDLAMTIGVYRDGTLVASGVFLLGPTHAVYKYGASEPSAWKLRPNHLMLSVAFDRLAERDASTMDFGLTDLANTSLREFKGRWGGQETAASFSATDPRLLPNGTEPGRLLTATIRHTPVLIGRAIGTLAYRYMA
jgi:CelD/BcsL family acetyltransferase involved in cellulose biosynthesis